ncbi:hypothetical protein NNJEOMEG_02084 [Fundidesulfovibrio magnetotacticus]|uniref:ADP-heptose:LPS heptosyltransferase n=1 Tax=Fundidesulfovibrio magnetotacticus TaxID=2730080 RepID=A0A6V8LNR3_9BACT|nr:glycosyltransferase family 9 protein [Fundidesulfovibrio magnetotacticus]GFK94242.1 hypothetical protein NNJEOMEG_02084 [Fundidesulfovibrio magnetotacticus]
MKPALVIQLARFGDLLQTKRLVLGLEAAGRVVHLLVDRSLDALARLVYPRAAVHALDAHSRPDPAAAERVLAELACVDFYRVHNLNHSGMSLAVSALFDPGVVRGHKLHQGQPLRDPWASMALRWTRNRRHGGVNLEDYWAAFALPMAAPEAVNPAPEGRGGGLGVVLAGRESRRSLPPDVLAGVVQAVLPAVTGEDILLLGTAAERPAAKALASLLPPKLAARVQDLTGRTSLTELAGRVEGLDRVLTPDTGAMHLAAHLGVPVTAFFLSSAWCHETGPYGPGHTVWQAVQPCSPCRESVPCPNGWACLEAFRRREFLRLVSGRLAGDPPPGLVGLRTGFDALGALCEPFAGTDGMEDGRARLRGFVARHLGLAGGRTLPPEPELAERLEEEPDWLLDKPQPLHELL